ncbi:MAG TPA: acetyl/propionyl/methylcrotonyl-CoA carboxylase subunit alpha [Burkholderiales bacterium]|jgi:3-methylcrotonyl-CoA carboxylase alpha subunit|nr:acetyl/propionyl/methylcrotonyl-CoA carboxylase subunit alpha [Burkholderiales bacterium]
MFKKILIANRGEIACRVAATARGLGIQTVAVYSDADAGARHVAECDEAYHLGPAPAKESYLRGDAIIAIAKQSGAQAIHPGYGFLSENEDFAEACAKAGLVFIGPPPSAIRAMGLKAESKQLMEKAKVPLVPGYHGGNQDPAFLQQQADGIGYPVLIKASAGGGGKGMRIVEKSADFAAALASCKREASSSFGDEAVLIEKYLQRPRHIEIQVFADSHGECVYLFERDCSVQRRHQKVLEEAPAPGMSAERRQAMGEAAVAAAKAVGYVGAGTVEFIADQGGTFFFMEMNTRLQVEHPVTEEITGLDLVEWQLRVADGEPLPLTQDELAIDGHAIEARIYAENPLKNFLPSIGTISHMRMPVEDGPVRIDSGVREGDAISPYYDPMIAKLIVWGADRDAALAAMAQALRECEISGVATNVEFLGRVIACKDFATGAVDTGLIERNRDELLPAKSDLPPVALALAAFAQVRAEQAATTGPASPWDLRDGWRMHLTAKRVLEFKVGAVNHAVEVEYRREGILITVGGISALAQGTVAGRKVTLSWNGERVLGQLVTEQGGKRVLFSAGRRFDLELVDAAAQFDHEEEAGGGLTAPMSGKVLSVLVQAGAEVEKGAPLLVMEAMKMEHTISAPAKGKVIQIRHAAGEQVAEGVELVAFEPAAP